MFFRLSPPQAEPSPMKTTWYCPLDLVRPSVSHIALRLHTLLRQGESEPVENRVTVSGRLLKDKTRSSEFHVPEQDRYFKAAWFNAFFLKHTWISSVTCGTDNFLTDIFIE